MRRHVPSLALFCIWLAPGAADALVVEHEAVSLVVAPESGRVCVNHPRAMYRTEDCAEYYPDDPGDFGADAAVVFIGIVAQPNAVYGLTIVSIGWVDPDTLSVATHMLKESTRTLLRDEWGVGALDVQSREYQLGEMSLLEVHATADLSGAVGPYTPTDLLAYIVAYDTGTLMVWADTDMPLELVRADVEHMLRTASFTGVGGAPPGRDRSTAYVCGRLTGATLFAGLFLGLVVWVSRRSSRSGTATAPTAATEGAHRVGKLMVVANGAQLGPVCVKCGNVSAPHKRKVVLWYYPPWILIFLLGALIVTVILYYITRQRVDLEVALCDRHQTRWTHCGWVGVLGTLAFIVGAVGAAVGLATETAAQVVLIWVLVAGLGVAGVVWSLGSRVSVAWADQKTAKLRGVSPQVEAGVVSVFE